jgi:hypothetical protein
MIDDADLHRLRQMRDDLEWLHDKITHDPEYHNTPYRHYRIQIQSTEDVVRSIIQNVKVPA